MLNSFLKIGEEKWRDISIKEESEKKIEFLKTILETPKRRVLVKAEFDENNIVIKDPIYAKELIINLNTIDETIEIKKGEIIDESLKDSFFGLKIKGNEKKIIFNINSWKHLTKILNHIPLFVSEKTKDENIKIGVIEELNDFSSYLKELRDKFMLHEENQDDEEIEEKNEEKIYNNKTEFAFNRNKFTGEFKKVYEETSLSLVEERKKKKAINTTIDENDVNFINTVMEKAIEKFTEDKGLNNFSLLIDNQHILNTKYRESYINILYYEKNERFFSEKGTQLCHCSMCSEEKITTSKIDIPVKIYITDKNIFFNNNKDDAFRYFSLCKDCFEKILYGIKEVDNKYSGRMFGLNYYLIPKTIMNIGISNYKEEIKQVMEFFNERNSYIKLETTSKNTGNLKFDLMFYEKPEASSAFNVKGLINNISFQRIKQINDTIQILNEETFSFKGTPKIAFGDLYYMVFQNKLYGNDKNGKLKTTLTNKYNLEYLDFMEALLKGSNINRKNFHIKLISTFIEKYKQESTNFNDAFYLLKVVKLIEILRRLKMIDIVQEESKNFYHTINNSDFTNYFELNKYEYYYSKDAKYKQGVFLLGVLINEVYGMQKSKGHKFNIFDRFNMYNIKKEEIKKIINITASFLLKYSKSYIYKDQNSFKISLFDFNEKLFSAMAERIEGIENSELSMEEITLHLLFGKTISYFSIIKRVKENQEVTLNESIETTIPTQNEFLS